MKNTRRHILFVFMGLLFITSCGGGGGGGAPPPPAGSSDWDTMVWDQDNWD